MKKNYSKPYYIWWVLLVLWCVMLVFSLLVSFHVIPWRSTISGLQYAANILGLFSSVANVRFWRKKADG